VRGAYLAFAWYTTPSPACLYHLADAETRLGRKGDKILYFYDYGCGKGQRPSTGLFTATGAGLVALPCAKPDLLP